MSVPVMKKQKYPAGYLLRKNVICQGVSYEKKITRQDVGTRDEKAGQIPVTKVENT